MPSISGGESSSSEGVGKGRNESPEMHAALVAFIRHQRQQKQEAAEAAVALERQRRERAERKERDAQTLEQTNATIATLRTQMETLQKEKHDLFAKLKRVVNQEDEQKKRMVLIQEQQQRDAREILDKVNRDTLAAASKMASAHLPPPPPPPKGLGTLKRPADSISASPSPGSSPAYYSSPKAPTSRTPFQPPPPKLPTHHQLGSPPPSSHLPPPPPPPRMSPLSIHSQSLYGHQSRFGNIPPGNNRFL